MVLLCLPVQDTHVGIEAGEMNRVVALHVVEARKHRPIVHTQRDDARRHPSQRVRERPTEDVLSVSHNPCWARCRHGLQEALTRGGSVVRIRIDLMDFVCAAGGLRLRHLRPPCQLKIDQHHQQERRRDQLAPTTELDQTAQHRTEQQGRSDEPDE
ncbi:MAG TPA: hypothetical protein VK898_18700 [Chloroflexota bacterium]|nr:hypothetical protein [Chloroflexota bacterium]